MVKVRPARQSGASGEIARLLRGRSDLARWQTGFARLQNVAPLPEGAAQRRSGTRFVLPLKDESQPGLLVDFEAAAGDSYILVFNAGVMRVVTGGGFVVRPDDPNQPYELATGFTAADLDGLQVAQSIDQVFIALPGRKQKILTRLAPNNWTLADFEVVEGPVEVQNTNKAITVASSGTTGNVLLVATSGIFKPGHVGSVWRFDEANLADIPAWKAIEVVTVGAKRRNRGNVYEAIVAGADTGPNPPVHDDGDWSSGSGNTTWRFLYTTSGFVRITRWLSDTSVRGDVVKRLPDSVQLFGTFRWFEAAWSEVKGWPSTVALFDGAIVWARGNSVWSSKPTDLYSYDETDPAEGAWSQRLLSPDGKLVQIQWLQPAGVLILGTRSGVWVLRGKDAYERLTVTSIRALPQSSYGSGPAPAVMAEGGAIYVGRSRRNAYFARFDAIGERVEVSDLTRFSRRMLHGRAAQIADQRDPYRIMWFRTERGQLRGLTFVPEEDNLGWCRLTTAGEIEQVACVQSADETLTELWMIVKRTINGAPRRYIEVLQPFFEAEDEDEPTAAGAWMLDCALRYQGPPATVISGLEHLEGMEVGVFADGDERGRRTVQDGRVTLDAPGSDVVVGLPVSYKIELLPLDLQTAQGPTFGQFKSVGKAALLLHESAGGRVAQKGMPAFAIEPPGRNLAGGPRALRSGVVVTSVTPTNDREATIVISGDDAMPFTLLAAAVDVDVGAL